jgi:hypothetical protein
MLYLKILCRFVARSKIDKPRKRKNLVALAMEEGLVKGRA